MANPGPWAATAWHGGDGDGVYGVIAYEYCEAIASGTGSKRASWPHALSGGVRGIAVGRLVNVGHRTIKSRSSGILILFLGSHSKMRLRIESSSGDRGRMELRKRGFFR